MTRSFAWIEFADTIVRALQTATTREEIASLMQAIAQDLGFGYYALIHHDDLSPTRPDLVDIKHYPAAITERLFGQRHYKRDPIIRGCIFADSAFLWSDLPRIIRLDKQDQVSFEVGAREGLNEGITVPYVSVASTPPCEDGLMVHFARHDDRYDGRRLGSRGDCSSANGRTVGG